MVNIDIISTTVLRVGKLSCMIVGVTTKVITELISDNCQSGLVFSGVKLDFRGFLLVFLCLFAFSLCFEFISLKASKFYSFVLFL